MCRFVYVFMAALMGIAMGCGDSEGTEADKTGVGAQCTDNSTCESADEEIELVCLTQFTGGYCGLEGCTGDVDCPEGSACVTHDDGKNYCFLVCVDKADCNRNRDEENWSNCVGSITFVDDRNDRKACEPPSSGL